uniref:Uncharacterized protein n=1 Tax=Panagrolaimus sp. ES5 TaxID=591445 RepID=A0AC34FP60_9BILA
NKKFRKTAATSKILDNALTDDCPKNLKLWNKSTKNQPLKILCALNFYDESEKDAKKCWKDNNSNFSANSSTLSLHIAAYENSFEHSNEQCKDSSIKIKEAKQFGFSSELQNLFEFRRQMEDNESRTPQVMQFKASQKLLNPNEVVPEKSDLVDSGNAETEAKENPEGAAGIAITSSSATSTTVSDLLKLFKPFSK